MPSYLLPDVGEGLTEAEIVAWKVKVGDVVAINDVVVEIETAKSLVELPSPYAGEPCKPLDDASHGMPDDADDAFAGGATLGVLANSLMPEAYREGGWWVGLATAAGFLLAFVLG